MKNQIITEIMQAILALLGNHQIEQLNKVLVGFIAGEGVNVIFKCC